MAFFIIIFGNTAATEGASFAAIKIIDDSSEITDDAIHEHGVLNLKHDAHAYHDHENGGLNCRGYDDLKQLLKNHARVHAPNKHGDDGACGQLLNHNVSIHGYGHHGWQNHDGIPYGDANTMNHDGGIMYPNVAL